MDGLPEERTYNNVTAAMRSRDVFLVYLNVLGTAVCWWPLLIEPNLDLEFWVALACAAGCTGLSILLAPAAWPLLLVASGMGTFGGFSLGFRIWPPDPLAGEWVLVFVALTTLVVMFVALCAGLIMRRRSLSNEALRRPVWATILACVAFGPVTLLLTPPLVRNRVARNDRMAAERFESLKKAVKSAKAEAGGSGRICDGTDLGRHYTGPPFSETDWRRITGNYVKQDGYFFMVYCREPGGGYTIHASPERPVGYGTRQFCAEASGKSGCRMDYSHSCLPCPK